MTAATLPLLGRQEPTFLWVPPHEDSLGDGVIELFESTGRRLDEWQKLLIRLACSVDPVDAWLCFEVAIVVSRQNGKGEVLQALELAWLFMFHDELIIHSAHLFETSREHFLKMTALIRDHDAFRRRVRKVREGRGSEEIELLHRSGSAVLQGPRLKFMTRKGGAGRGFTGNKVVFDEAMYLDSLMMAAGLPTLATIPNAQVIYAGSAGMRHSTQLAAVRRRAYRRDDPALVYAEWAAQKAIYDAQGDIISGDDPADPATHAKTNPAFGIRLSPGYIRKEMAALGGPRSGAFETERLGIGDWPAEDDLWEVISKEIWESRADPASKIPDDAPIALAIDADEERSMGTIAVCGLREDGRRHVEIIDRRGTGWIVDRVKELQDKHKTVCAVVVLKTSAAASLIKALVDAGLPVFSPSEGEYAQACGQFFEAVVELDTIRHIDQKSMNSAVGGARTRTNVEGGWRWSRDGPVDAGPIVAPTLALWGLETQAEPDYDVLAVY